MGYIMINDSNNFSSESTLEEHRALINSISYEAKMRNEFSFSPDHYWFFLYSALILFFILILLLVLASPRRGSFDWIAPWYVWVTDIVLFVVSIISFKGLSTNYSLDLKREKIIKKTNFFYFKTEKEITSFDKVKLIGISTTVKIDNNQDKGKQVEYTYETLAIYKDNNTIKAIILNKMPGLNNSMIINHINANAEVAAIIIGCKYIACDKSSKIVLKSDNLYQNDIDSLITLIPKEQQLPGIDFSAIPEKNILERNKYN